MRPTTPVFFAIGFLFAVVAKVDGAPADFDVQGHRGCRGLAPENTMAAFEKAIELGVTTIELDVLMTRDGVFVVHHDLRLNPKLCRSPVGDPVRRLPVADVDYSDISNLDCGSQRSSKFPDQALSPGERIPRLEEVLGLAAGAPYPVQLSIEIKQPTGKLPQPLEVVVAKLVGLVREMSLGKRAIIQSRWGEVLAEVRKQAPDLERSLIVRTASAKPWVADGTATIVSRKRVYLDRSEVESLQRKGVRMIPWTVNDPKAIRKMMDWGVDGIIPDSPDRALAILNERNP